MMDIFEAIKAKFRVSSEGRLDNFLGIKVEQERLGGAFELSMSEYVDKMFTRYKMSVKQSVLTPMVENFQAQLEEAPLADEQFVEDFCYSEKIGSLLFLMVCIRLDIAFAVCLLARYCNKVSKVACAGVTRVLQYVFNTKHRSLRLGANSLYISAFTDSDWAGCRITRCSTGGYIIFVGCGAVAWGSRLQKMPAQSVAEAEYIVMNDPLKTMQWIRWMFRDSGIEQLATRYSSTLFGDNTASHAMALNPVASSRCKHIAIKYHYVRALIEAGVVCPEHVGTDSNVADLMTKPLGKLKHSDFSDQGLGHSEFVQPTKRVETEKSDEFA